MEQSQSTNPTTTTTTTTSSSSSSSIVVSYHTSPSPDVWGRIQADLHRQLPLKNLSWKPKNRQLRLISSLPISFQAFDSPNTDSSPSVYLLFVACDDHEAYKTIVKQEIRTWLDTVQANHSEWLIVHVSTAPKLNLSTTAGIFRSKTGLLDKLKADFNPQKIERCIQLSYMSTMDSIVQASMQDTSTQWSELISRLKQSLLLVFEFKINEMEESLRMIVSKRSRHGWDFQEFFIQKAQLANQFEIMNLFVDSLIQYDELDAAFSQSLSDCPQIWHDKVYGKNSSQYSRLALNNDVSEKYLEIVGAGQMTIFDLRIYVFSKQVNLLGRLNRLDEAMKRASIFISTFAAFLRSHQHIWPANYIESWVYCACNELVEWCEERIIPGSKDIATLDSLRCCAQLLELAHSQLDRIGIQAGHLPSIHPFNMSLSQSTTRDTPSGQLIESSSSTSVTSPTNSIEFLKDPETFEKVYLDLGRRTINLYQSTGRRRSALKLHCKTAGFEQIQSRLESAHRLYSHLPAHYVDDKWTTIESSLLDKCASLQKNLGLSREWLLSTLALVRSGVTYEAGKWSQDVMIKSPLTSSDDDDVNQLELPKDQSTLAIKLMNDIKDQSLKLEKDFAAIGFPIFSITLSSSIGRLSETVEGSIVEAKITNLLPCSIHVEAIRMKFLGRKSESLWFTAGTSELLSGQTTIDLFCPTPVNETLILDVSQIRISRILFQYYHRPQASTTTTANQNEKNLAGDQEGSLLEIVSFPKDLLGLDFKLSLSPDIRLGQIERNCVLSLFSGRRFLSKASVSIASSESDIIKFDLDHSSVCDEHFNNQIEIIHDSHNNKVTLEAIEPESTVFLTIPFSTSATESSVDVNISVDYRTSEDPSIKRCFRKPIKLKISVPIEVKIREIFRSNWMFAKFTLGTDRCSPLRIQGTELRLNDETGTTASASPLLSITSASPNSSSIVILPSQTSDFIFKVVPTNHSDSTNFSEIVDSSELNLIVKYRLIIDEIGECLRSKLMLKMDETEKKVIGFLIEQVKEIITKDDERFDSEFYSSYLFDKDHVLHSNLLLNKVDWNLVCERIEKDQVKKKDLVDRISTIIQDCSPVVCHPDVPWQTITLPFKLSKSVILTTITYERDEDLIGKVGKPIPIDLLISTSFKWLNLDLNPQPIHLVYEILNSSDQWLIGGKKRGKFIAQDNGIETVKMILVPLKPGYLNVPQVTIKLPELDNNRSISTTTTGDNNNNNHNHKKNSHHHEILIQSSYSNSFHPILVLPSITSSKFIVPPNLP
ncbi:hypothetical protein PSTG_16267 [Puccinia striiformis f. sp. tritici PST-78]|uniref:Trafficking protein particle complex subunit 11 domain-containing protein n=1 Tax=Puccinia striiformis f. sp. tritici PST-78 TaxID=1165861 RepID=A0A0L0UU35_9BASI|nr:hypothetical protein PSTG_16267 [Puccinia striiformis f. sp. tritici PST-78]